MYTPHEVPFEESDLSPADIRKIAGYAGGLYPTTVEKYLRGMNTNARKRKLIERALRELGWANLIRKAR